MSRCCCVASVAPQLMPCRCAYELCPYPAHSSGNWKTVQVTCSRLAVHHVGTSP